MRTTEIQITGYDGAAILFAIILAADGAKVIRPGTSADGDAVIGEARQKAAEAFTAVGNLMDDILCASMQASP